MTVITQNPSATVSIVPRWLLPERAYTSDNLYTYTISQGAIQQYHDYNFDGVLPPNIAISKVEVGLEFYCLAYENLSIRISTDGGSTWSAWSNPFTLTAENIIWVDVTAYHPTWLRDHVLNANWKVQVKYVAGGGAGCPLKEAWTPYLDWIPTRVTYEEVVARLKRMMMKVGL